MADLFGIKIETPQEVLARLNQQREVGMRQAAGDPGETARLRVAGLMDKVFGNPEVRKAQEQQDSLKAARVDANQRITENPDMTEEQKQILRLQSLRDSVEESNPALAYQIDDKIRAVRVAQLEQRKLQQQVTVGDKQIDDMNRRFIMNPETLQSEEVDLSTPEGAQKVLEARRNGWAVAQKEGNLVNLFNAERARQFNAQQATLDRAAKLQEKELAKKGSYEITDTRKTQMQKSIEATRQLTDRWKRVSALMKDPELMTVLGRVQKLGLSGKALAGFGLSASQREKYDRATALISSAMGAANILIKERSGAAVTEQEWERLKKELPTWDDDPAAFKRKMQEQYMLMMRSNRRLHSALEQNDWRVTDQEGTKWASKDDVLFRDLSKEVNLPGEVAPSPAVNPGKEGPASFTPIKTKNGVTIQ